MQAYTCDSGQVNDVYRCYATEACQNSFTTERDSYSLLVDTRLSEEGGDDTLRIGTAAGRTGNSFN